MSIVKDIWKLSQDLNIYDCQHVYREVNTTVDRLAKKDIDGIDSIIW